MPASQRSQKHTHRQSPGPRRRGLQPGCTDRCDGQHKYAYTDEMVEELAMDIGFECVERAANDRDANIREGSLSEPDGSFSVNIYKAGR